MDVYVHGQSSGDFPGSDRPGSSSDHQTADHIGKQIFCNRPLNMEKIRAVGFDMDYTLAQYKPETFESLAHHHTVRKLVDNLNYPDEILSWKLLPEYMIRGLVLDKKRGNILKMDRHKYVEIAYHGFELLSYEDKAGTYGNTLVHESFDEPDYAPVDTLFPLPVAYLFAQLVDLKDKFPRQLPPSKDYVCMYKDVQEAVDLCFQDRTLQQEVAKDPVRYINEDTTIVPMLKMLKDSGRSTFLLTNSLWDYTSIVMNFLCGSNGVNSSSTNFDWLQYFDVVITGSANPSFLHEGYRANLFEVELESGMLLNTDNCSPVPQVGNISGRLQTGDKNRRKVFQGGSISHLHKLLSIKSSSQVLYVGNHIYGDILRSKKVPGWRTMLVIPELEKEVKLLWELRDPRKKLLFLRSHGDCIEDKIHHLKQSLKFMNPNHDAKPQLINNLVNLELQRYRVRLTLLDGERTFLHQKFHEIWGQLMKTGYQNSRFAHQVEKFACLYTGRASNLVLYSLDKHYPSEDFMHHEFGTLAVKP